MAIMRPLSKEQYAKTEGRHNLAALPYVEKVKCVIELQKRLQPIYAKRGIIIKPWKSFEMGETSTESFIRYIPGPA